MTGSSGTAAAVGTKPVVWVHTNDHQLLAAKVAAHAFRSRSRHADEFDVRLLRLEETPRLVARDGQRHVWNGGWHTFRCRDANSFLALRRLVPELMGFRGRALVVDPDVFAVGDVFELLCRDMRGKAILCRRRYDTLADPPRWTYATSVMLLDCARLTHWQWDREMDEIFRGAVDFGPWIGLTTEPAVHIGALEDEWNDFDTLTERTKLLHNTERRTQPWATGLPVDAHLLRRSAVAAPRGGLLQRVLRRIGSASARPEPMPLNMPHPDPQQERLFFALLAECLETGEVSEDLVREAIRRGYVRTDAFEVLAAPARTTPTV
jgi:hypothetical protein